jgi:hypothetical protein
MVFFLVRNQSRPSPAAHRRQALCDIALEEQFKVNTTGGGTALPGRIGACVFRKANKDRNVSRKVKSYKNNGKLHKTTFYNIFYHRYIRMRLKIGYTSPSTGYSSLSLLESQLGVPTRKFSCIGVCK